MSTIIQSTCPKCGRIFEAQINATPDDELSSKLAEMAKHLICRQCSPPPERKIQPKPQREVRLPYKD